MGFPDGNLELVPNVDRIHVEYSFCKCSGADGRRYMMHPMIILSLDRLKRSEALKRAEEARRAQELSASNRGSHTAVKKRFFRAPRHSTRL